MATKPTVKEGTPIETLKNTQEISEEVTITKPLVKDSESENILYMDSYTTCKNLCSWDLFFELTQGGDKTIKSNGTLDLLNRDIVSLCNNNNIFFIGTDGQGSHARVHILNPQLRVHVGFENENRKQTILDEEKLREIFNVKTQKQFEEAVCENVVEFHEKDIVIGYARKIKENDYDRITFLEAYTGRSFR